MLINFEQVCRKFKLRPKGVIVVGAHWGEEHEVYLKCGIKKIVYIEPCAEQFSKLESKFKHNQDVLLFNVACGNYSGQVTMNIETANNGQSNSILTPAKHLQAHPEIKFNGTEIVDICKLDDLEFDRSEYDMLMMDCQGYEHEVLKGAIATLKHIKVVYTEVNTDELYEKCAQTSDIKRLLPGFRVVHTSMTRWGWGDQILIRK